MQKILCVGDGFGKGHIWPMWPQLLPKIVDNVEIDNLCEVGAGNEYISNCVIDACERKKYDLVLVQWALSNRLDIVKNNENNIAKMILQDQTYNTKYSNVKLNDRAWWLSSGSQLEQIQNYHEKLMSKEQHKIRSINYIKFVDLYLTTKQTPFAFFSSYNLDFVDLSESQSINWSKWCNRNVGMEEYGQTHLSKYQTDDVQPHTMIHLHYLENVLCPFVQLQINQSNLLECKKEYE
jgi:hypothetical protein